MYLPVLEETNNKRRQIIGSSSALLLLYSSNLTNHVRAETSGGYGIPYAQAYPHNLSTVYPSLLLA